MRPNGTTQLERRANLRKWEEWLNHSKARRELTDFAARLVELIEARVGSPRTQHVAALAEKAITEAGGQNLTRQEIRRVLILLKEVWFYGMALRNWSIKSRYMKLP